MPKRNIVWIVAIVMGALVTVWVIRKEPAPVRDEMAEQFLPVQQAYRQITEKYYQPLEPNALHRAAVKGMVAALDPYCRYLLPEQAEGLQRRVTRGLQRGLGLRVHAGAGAVTIEEIMVNSPAHHAGLLPGDRIISIGERKLGKVALDELTELLDGPLGSKVLLMVVRTGGKPRRVSLVRGEYPVESVEGLYRDGDGRWVYFIEPVAGIGYVRINEFVETTERQFQRVLSGLGRLRGLILDLRDNPGGTLESAVKVSDMFLRKGLIVTTILRGKELRSYWAHRDGTSPNVPMVVLIDAGTASAAEVVCGSLRARGRAVLVGTRTLGKGCVQSIFPLSPELGKLSLTTSEFRLGPDIAITRLPGSDKWGVDPHVQVVVLPSRHAKLNDLRHKAGALRPPRKVADPATLPSGDEIMPQQFLSLDTQLAQAAELLKDPEEIKAILAEAAEASESETDQEQQADSDG